MVPEAARGMGPAECRPDPLEGLAKLLFGQSWRTGLIWMAAVYFDESESQNPRDVFVLAGCVSTCERWITFKDAWQRRLTQDKITYWHTTDWAGRFPPYDKLTDSAHAALGEDLRALIEGENVLHCTIEVIPAKFYREIFLPQLHRDALRAYRDPYFFCFLSCLSQISLRRHEGKIPDERVQCFFERRDPRRDRRLMREYERVRHEFFPGEFGVITSGTKVDPEVMPCQAADLVAYNCMKYVRRHKAGHLEDVPPIDLQGLSEKNKLSGGSFSEPGVWTDYIKAVMAHQNAKKG